MSVVKRIVSAFGARHTVQVPKQHGSPAEQLRQTARERNNTGMLVALGNRQKHVYEGTVSGVEKAKRRAKNKAARRARRVGRR